MSSGAYADWLIVVGGVEPRTSQPLSLHLSPETHSNDPQIGPWGRRDRERVKALVLHVAERGSIHSTIDGPRAPQGVTQAQSWEQHEVL